jgi:recombination protein RecA
VSSYEDKLKAATTAIKEINKEYPGSIRSLGDKVGEAIPVIPTGLYSVDYHVLGVGGIPRGRITEVFGTPSGGKTTLCLRAIAEAQRMGELAAVIDAEHALDPTWAAVNGVDVDKLFVSQPDSGEEGLRIAERLIETASFGIIVIDSVAALVPLTEINGEIGDAFVGVQARMMSQGLRKLASPVAKANTALVFINQIREKIGVMYGNPETTTGGKALGFYASVRLDVRRIGQQKKDKDIVIGHTVKIKAPKNKVGAPYREAEIDFYYDQGFDRYTGIIDAAVEANVIQKSGSWFSYQDARIGQGKDAVVEFLKSNNLYNAIVEGINNAKAS